jgi:hypothetical protein
VFSLQLAVDTQYFYFSLSVNIMRCLNTIVWGKYSDFQDYSRVEDCKKLMSLLMSKDPVMFCIDVLE